MDKNQMDENRIGEKQDSTKRFGPKPVGRKGVGRKLGARFTTLVIKNLSIGFFIFNSSYYVTAQLGVTATNCYINFIFIEHIMLEFPLEINSITSLYM